MASVLTKLDVEEAICYNYQAGKVLRRDFNVTKMNLNSILENYMPIYNGLLAKYAGDDLESIIVRQLLRQLINPNKLQRR